MTERLPTTEADLESVTVGHVQRLTGRIELAESDPAWPAAFQREATRIRALLAEAVRLLEHVGSTSVPGLAAKPIIGNGEIDRMIGFRDRLRAHPDELQRYLNAKRALAARDWAFVQHYADAKSEVVEEIMARGERAAAGPPG